jgi:hypothetical protein
VNIVSANLIILFEDKSNSNIKYYNLGRFWAFSTPFGRIFGNFSDGDLTSRHKFCHCKLVQNHIYLLADDSG